MATTALWALIEEWRDAQLFPVSQAAIASRIGVQRSAMSQWKSGQAKPTPENLRKIAALTRIPYGRLLEALNRDMGYLGADEPMVADKASALQGMIDDAAARSGGVLLVTQPEYIDRADVDPGDYVVAASDADDDAEIEAWQQEP